MRLILIKVSGVILVIISFIFLLPYSTSAQPSPPNVYYEIKDKKGNTLDFREVIVLDNQAPKPTKMTSGVFMSPSIREEDHLNYLYVHGYSIDLTLVYKNQIMKIVGELEGRNGRKAITFQPGVYKIIQSRKNKAKSQVITDVETLYFLSNKVPTLDKLDGQQALNWVCYTGEINTLNFVLETFNKINLNYNEALGIALVHNSYNLVESLATLGASIKLIPQDIILTILMQNSEKSIQLLIDAKIDFNFRLSSPYGFRGVTSSPLGLVISSDKSNTNIAKKLIDAGADVNLDPRYLSYASSLELMNLLISRGLNTKSKYPISEYPYSVREKIRLSNDEQTTEMDQEQLTIIDEALRVALERCFFESCLRCTKSEAFATISFLVKQGANINFKFYFFRDFKQTPLQVTEERQCKELTDLLKTLGATKN